MFSRLVSWYSDEFTDTTREERMTIQLSRRNLVSSGIIAGATLATSGRFNARAAQNDKPTIVVGSKDVTETLVLAELSALLLEDAGYPVDRQLNLGGTLVAHDAAVSGEIDTYVEYTGTALLAILDMELPEPTPGAGPVASPATAGEGLENDPVYDFVAGIYPERFGITWLEPWGFNNTYVMAVREETAAEFDLTSISDLREHAGNMVVGGTQEFLVRPDGLPALEDRYEIGFGDTIGLDQGLMYSAIDQGDVDIISATSTDGRVAALGLVMLVDDRDFFPNYFAAPIVRQDVLEKSPGVADALNRLAGRISDEKMAELNLEVDEGGQEPEDVARSFLTSEGLIRD